MKSPTNSSWKKVNYSYKNKVIPEERWGHRFVKVSQTEIVMFGGYGSSSKYGKYFDDVWTYNIIDNQWTKISTSGNKPRGRSNYTIHFNQQTQQIILFGGGADRRMRFNDVCILNWKAKVWRIIEPKQDSPRPWERTYHTSEFMHPYLIVFGGESVSHVDSNDMWVFNIETSEWKQLKFNEQIEGPCQRRFHSSAFIDGFYYVLGGCQDTSYSLLGDIYRVNLQKLFQNTIFDNFQWQCVLQRNEEFKRWGHSTDVYEQKIYIAFGRKNSSLDSDQLFVFDPKTFILSQYKSQPLLRPKPRRKHSSVVIGNSLLVYGGYNGKYLQDFDYINLQPKMSLESSKIKVISADSIQQMMRHLTRLQQQPIHDIVLKLMLNNKVIMKLKSNKKLLGNNLLLKYLCKNVTDQQLTIFLPQFADLLSFRLIHAFTISKSIPISNRAHLQLYCNILKSAQYFCCLDLYQPIQQILLERLDEENCEEIFQLATDLDLQTLKQSAAQIIFISQQRSDWPELQTGNPQESSKHLKDTIPSEYLSQLYSKIKFDVQQRRLQQQKKGIFSKATDKIIKFFNSNKITKPTTSNSVQSLIEEDRKSCLTQFAEFVSKLCRKQKIEPQ